MGNDTWKNAKRLSEQRREYHNEYRKKVLMAGKRSKLRKITTTITKPTTSKVVVTSMSPAPISQHEVSDAILLTGGIGDVIVLESHFPALLRSNLKTIYYASVKNTSLRGIMSALNFPKLCNHIAVWNDFSKFWCFISKQHVIEKISHKIKSVVPELTISQDWSINDKFPKIRLGKYEYHGSSLLKQNLVNISRFNIPNNYAVICPYSSDKRGKGRDFTPADWSAASKQLKIWNLTGVIINHGQDTYFPNDDIMINLSNKTTILEAIEILKQAKGYIGIDSCLSVLAAQKFDISRLVVKCINPHCLSWKDVYYSPKKDFSFIKEQI